ncbi:MAG: excinuclease ABC subunit C [Saprospiraceae bacterium]|uniref:UvrABC system protein C n=1 Tax=Candidatus Defluviibacterium haderslevense TaxID=2981993 RepID=A0A9D7S6T8_9BACT|nr:excinuclease ABC subunit C [Candidatus Defluviibacterium haderslevense]MBL0238626.1 excinuclease ABC subunit C [Candidatus Defluviibacterium haderslevense]
MTYEEFKLFATGITTEPGVYRFLDSKGVILYVGKAKNLKNRLNSYFGDKKYITGKTKALTKSAHKIEFTIVETEHDALLLEATLIKKNQPRYNVMLKDGKTYSYICIKNEPFPRVLFTRKIIKDGSVYFGPYTSKFRTEVILELIKGLFPLRSCALNLNPNLIAKNKYKVCLEYHIKNCMGPCEHFESEIQYNERIFQIKNILKGHFKPVKEFIKFQMNKYAETLDFEKAQLWKLKLSAFEDYQSKSTVVSHTIQDVDVFSVASDDETVYINFMKVIQGAINQTITIEATKNLDDDLAKILTLAIQKIREQFNSIAPEIIVPMQVETIENQVSITVPLRGDKKKLLDLSQKNAQYFLMQKKREAMNKTAKQSPAERILTTLKTELSMTNIPLHIECFDNSNIQGTNPVSACVVFKNAKPSKKDYRHYNIKTVVGPNDFASMEEVIYRRYKRLKDEGQTFPQLIIIDGGKGQLSSAMKAIDELQLRNQFTVIGIAKKLEEIYFPDDPVPLHINKKSESLKLIQQLRNEAHRFGITFHRLKRSKSMITSELDQIKGIGTKSTKKLLSHFGSVSNIKTSTMEDITAIVGASMAQKLIEFFNHKSD